MSQSTRPEPDPEPDAPRDAREWAFDAGALALSILAAVCALRFELMPLLFGALGARSASLALARSRALSRGGPKARLIASIAVGLVALGLCGGLAAWGMGSAAKAAKRAPEIAERLAEQAREAKQYLPDAVANRIPDDEGELRDALADALAQAAPGIASAGKSWGSGALFAAVGWIVGLMMANLGERAPAQAPLARSLRGAGSRLARLFEQIVVAQFFVACANTVFAAIYMFAILPMAGIKMPWAPALLALTLALSMIPAAGNVMCNAVMALVSLTVSPGLAAATLVYLIAVHKVEYFISAKVLGSRVSMATWELLLAMFVLEAIFGVAGLVAAPFFYAHLKAELARLGWI